MFAFFYFLVFVAAATAGVGIGALLGVVHGLFAGGALVNILLPSSIDASITPPSLAFGARSARWTAPPKKPPARPV